MGSARSTTRWPAGSWTLTANTWASPIGAAAGG